MTCRQRVRTSAHGRLLAAVAAALGLCLAAPPAIAQEEPEEPPALEETRGDEEPSFSSVPFEAEEPEPEAELEAETESEPTSGPPPPLPAPPPMRATAKATATPPPIEPASVAAPEPASDLSPQHAALELRFGPYLPRVDDGTTTPVFERFFGDDSRFLFGIEIDWQIWRAPYLGTLGLGAGWGYTYMSAPNVPPDGAMASEEPVAQESTLNIMPMYAVGVFRVDVLAREIGIPIVPYGKLGFAYALWWVNDGIGTARNDQGISGRDASTGTQAALGGMLLLDIFDPTSARALDATTGVNNSYVFFEWSWSDYDGAQMNVGASTWVTGLAIEM